MGFDVVKACICDDVEVCDLEMWMARGFLEGLSPTRLLQPSPCKRILSRRPCSLLVLMRGRDLRWLVGVEEADKFNMASSVLGKICTCWICTEQYITSGFLVLIPSIWLSLYLHATLMLFKFFKFFGLSAGFLAS